MSRVNQYCGKRFASLCITHPILLSLEHNQPSSTSRNQLVKHLLKVLRDLFESPLNRFVLPRVEHINEFQDRVLRFVEFFLSSDELVPLFREGLILFVGFLVDVGETFQSFIHFAKLFQKL